MIEILFIGGAMLLVFTIIALTVWAVKTSPADDAMAKLQKLADTAWALADTAIMYRKMGMDREAEEAFEESQRLNAMVWETINGANQ